MLLYWESATATEHIEWEAQDGLCVCPKRHKLGGRFLCVMWPSATKKRNASKVLVSLFTGKEYSTSLATFLT